MVCVNCKTTISCHNDFNQVEENIAHLDAANDSYARVSSKNDGMDTLKLVF